MNECFSDETQQHIFLCNNLTKYLTKEEKSIKYQDIYSGVSRQYKETALFIKLMNRRTKLMKPLKDLVLPDTHLVHFKPYLFSELTYNCLLRKQFYCIFYGSNKYVFYSI